VRYFSMFSGIGGFESGIQNAYRNKNRRSQEDTKEDAEKRKGLESEKRKEVGSEERQVSQHVNDSQRGCEPTCIGYSEVDKYAIQIYQRHFPGHKNYGDATKIKPEDLPDFDLLVGGFPCQAFSIAGKRKGFEDTRGTMFFEIARIIREKQPRFLLLENVKGLLSHNQGRTLATIINTLDELRYDVQWQVLNSKDFGVPQNRERVFIIGYLRGERRPEVFPIRENSTKTQIELLGTTKGENCTRHGERDVVMSKEGLCGALKATDYKQPPQLLELTTKQKQGYRVYETQGLSTTIVGHAGGVGAKTGLYAVPVLTPNREKTRQEGRRCKNNGDPSFTLTSQDQHGVYDGCRVRRLTPTECERLQGFPDGWTKYGINPEGKQVPISDTQRYKVLGNAVTVNVIEAIINRLI